ncbi:MAG TPA: hypothetical protein VGX78_06295, partial [Pirellulales bacterium]|nr:hypothetical protein [Pirellulales bacterium]
MSSSFAFCSRSRSLARRVSVAAFAAAALFAANVRLAAEDGPVLERASASHAQSDCIDCCASSDGTMLEDFCVSLDGRVLAVVRSAAPDDMRGLDIETLEDGDDEEPATESASVSEVEHAVPSVPAAAVHEVRVFDAQGNLSHKWALDFDGQAINVGPDGMVYVGGDGRLAKFDMDGNLLAAGDAPQVAAMQDAEQLRQAAQEQLESEIAQHRQFANSLRQQLKQVEEQAAKKGQPADQDEPDSNEASDENPPSVPVADEDNADDDEDADEDDEPGLTVGH